MEKLVKDFLEQKRFAVVGSFRNKSKYAYQILVDLADKGYEVFPVNPGIQEVEGKACYKRISDVTGDIDVANLVTPPLATEEIVQECLRKGIKRVWLQPGAESEAAIQFCHDNNIRVIHSMCVMMESLKEETR